MQREPDVIQYVAWWWNQIHCYLKLGSNRTCFLALRLLATRCNSWFSLEFTSLVNNRGIWCWVQAGGGGEDGRQSEEEAEGCWFNRLGELSYCIIPAWLIVGLTVGPLWWLVSNIWQATERLSSPPLFLSPLVLVLAALSQSLCTALNGICGVTCLWGFMARKTFRKLSDWKTNWWTVNYSCRSP